MVQGSHRATYWLANLSDRKRGLTAPNNQHWVVPNRMSLIEGQLILQAPQISVLISLPSFLLNFFFIFDFSKQGFSEALAVLELTL